jgi:hypothetical protein
MTEILNKYWWVLVGGCGCLIILPFLIAFFIGIILVAINPQAQIEKAKQYIQTPTPSAIPTALPKK